MGGDGRREGNVMEEREAAKGEEKKKKQQQQRSPQPLAGVKVLDLTRVLAGVCFVLFCDPVFLFSVDVSSLLWLGVRRLCLVIDLSSESVLSS